MQSHIERKQKWDLRFLELAHVVSKWSKDPSTGVGAVIANDNLVISVGYNGFPRNVLDAPENLNNREIKYKMVVHAEKNAILFAMRNITGFTIYATLPPCSQCAAFIIQSGLSRVVTVAPTDEQFKRWQQDIEIAYGMFIQAGVSYISYNRDCICL